jgi:hypothetical protein
MPPPPYFDEAVGSGLTNPKSVAPWATADFLEYFEEFLRTHPELPATRFGSLACADHGFMWRLRHGRANYSLLKLERAVKFVQGYDSDHLGIVLLRKRGIPLLFDKDGGARTQ